MRGCLVIKNSRFPFFQECVEKVANVLNKAIYHLLVDVIPTIIMVFVVFGSAYKFCDYVDKRLQSRHVLSKSDLQKNQINFKNHYQVLVKNQLNEE